MIYACTSCHAAICEHDSPICGPCAQLREDEGDYEYTAVLCTGCGGKFCLSCGVDTAYRPGADECSHFDWSGYSVSDLRASR
jgi:hypothetical protein